MGLGPQAEPGIARVASSCSMSRDAQLHDPVNHQGPASQDIQKRYAVGVGLRACQAAGQEGLGGEASMQRATGNGERVREAQRRARSCQFVWRATRGDLWLRVRDADGIWIDPVTLDESSRDGLVLGARVLEWCRGQLWRRLRIG